jgi:hypothetical protein
VAAVVTPQGNQRNGPTGPAPTPATSDALNSNALNAGKCQRSALVCSNTSRHRWRPGNSLPTADLAQPTFPVPVPRPSVSQPPKRVSRVTFADRSFSLVVFGAGNESSELLISGSRPLSTLSARPLELLGLVENGRGWRRGAGEESKVVPSTLKIWLSPRRRYHYATSVITADPRRCYPDQ